MSIKSKLVAAGAAVSAGALSLGANAAISLPSSFESTMAEAEAAITTAGTALIVLAVVGLAFRWIKGMFF